MSYGRYGRYILKSTGTMILGEIVPGNMLQIVGHLNPPYALNRFTHIPTEHEVNDDEDLRQTLEHIANPRWWRDPGGYGLDQMDASVGIAYWVGESPTGNEIIGGDPMDMAVAALNYLDSKQTQ